MKRLALHTFPLLRSSILALAVPVGLAGCGMSAGDDAAPDQGGNIGFGGAQDIGQFRQILEEGGIPGPNTLDANGFFSEHYVELPPPDCDQVLCLQSMLSVGQSWLDNGYQATLAVALNTPVDPATLERKPLNLIVVVDTSGSMSEDNRISYARQGLHLLVDELQDGDRMALVTYDTDVEVRAQLAAELDREQLHLQVEQLVANGATNIHDGLQTGFELALSALEPERQNRVILLSDGLATVGIRDDASIIAMAEEYIGSGIGLTTIGVGKEFNVELMRGLAERGAGNFYFLEDATAIQEVFTDELDYFVTPLALSVTVEVRAADAYQLGEVVGTRLWKTEGSVGSMFIPAAFLASREGTEPDPNGRRGGGSTLIIPMLPTGFTTPDPNAVAEVRVRYRLPDSDEYIEQIIEVRNPADPGITPEEAYYSHQAMAKQYAMYNLYLGLHQAATLAEYDYNCALATLQDLDSRTSSWNAELEDADLAADRELIGMFIENLAGQLEESGLDAEPALCTPGYPGEYPPGGYPDDYEDHVVYGCNAAPGGRAGLSSGLVLFAAVAVLVLRRPRMRPGRPA